MEKRSNHQKRQIRQLESISTRLSCCNQIDHNQQSSYGFFNLVPSVWYPTEWQIFPCNGGYILSNVEHVALANYNSPTLKYKMNTTQCICRQCLLDTEHKANKQQCYCCCIPLNVLQCETSFLFCSHSWRTQMKIMEYFCSVIFLSKFVFFVCIFFK